jgi:L-ascorbate metabolism protein UlaG (beta-lactamase superfamily)
MKKIQVALCLLALATLFGCAEKKPAAPAQKPKPVPVLPLTTNTTGKVQIQTVSGSEAYPYNTYVITSSKGESVIVDPTEMPPRSMVELNPALIVSTHGHMDHVDADWTQTYDCKKISYFQADMKTRDFRVYTVLSAHQGKTLGSSNVIAVFEVDGLRIAHMGDIGQDTLTKEQLKAIGNIDIAFMQFENNYSSMNLQNEKGFKLIEQLNPSVIVPTHYTDQGLAVIESKYGKVVDFANVLAVSPDDIPAKKLTVWRILNTHKYPQP